MNLKGEREEVEEVEEGGEGEQEVSLYRSDLVRIWTSRPYLYA